MIEYNIYNKPIGCCDPPSSQSFCGSPLCAELDFNNDIIYRSDYTYINSQQPKPRIDNFNRSIGKSASCVLDVDIQSFPNNLFCEDCTELEGIHQGISYKGVISNGSPFYPRQSEQLLIDDVLISKNGTMQWPILFCNESSKYSKCGINYGVVWLGTTNPSGLQYSQDHSVYIILDIYKSLLAMNVLQSSGIEHTSDRFQYSTFDPSYSFWTNIPAINDVSYRGYAYLGNIVSGYYNNINCKNIDVTLTNITGTFFCDWKNAQITIKSNNDDTTNRLYLFNREMHFDGTVNKYDNTSVACSTNTSFTGTDRDFTRDDTYTNVWYGTYNYPSIYKINIENDNWNKNFIELSGNHYLLLNRYVSDSYGRPNPTNLKLYNNHISHAYNNKLYEESYYISTSLNNNVYHLRLEDFEDNPSGIVNKTRCNPCKNQLSSDQLIADITKYPCINYLHFDITTRTLKLFSKYDVYQPIATFAGSYPTVSHNNLYLKDVQLDLPKINNVYQSQAVIKTSGIFDDFRVTVSPYSQLDIKQKRCLPKPRDLMFQNGKIPDAYLVHFGGWDAGLIYKIEHREPDVIQELYAYTGDAVTYRVDGWTTIECHGLHYADKVLGEHIPGYAYKYNRIATSSGCWPFMTNCNNTTWSAPEGDFLLERVKYQSSVTNCAIPFDCPSPTITNTHHDGHRYTYYNQCDSVCEWKSIDLVIKKVHPHGVEAFLTVNYQNSSCNLATVCPDGSILNSHKFSGLQVHDTCSGHLFSPHPNLVTFHKTISTHSLYDSDGVSDAFMSIRERLITANDDDYYRSIVNHFDYIADPTAIVSLDILSNNTTLLSNYWNYTYMERLPQVADCMYNNNSVGTYSYTALSGRIYYYMNDILTYHPHYNGPLPTIQGVYY